LANAWLAFAEDHDGQLVGGNITNKPGAWVLPQPSPSHATNKYAGIINGALYPYVQDVGLYRCPANPWPNPFCTYSIPGGANGENWVGYVRATTYYELKRPATTYIFLEEIDPRGYNIGSWVMDLRSDRWIDPLLLWHNNRTTLGFADGHAETHGWVDKSLIDWCSLAVEDPGNFRFGMTPPPDERQDIEYMARGFPCKSSGEAGQ
jgi:prepilin-type processing-associated H-X9-DG protein